MKNYDLNNVKIGFHNVLFAYTSPIDYEMNRAFLLEDMPCTGWEEYVLVEGYHCSCYGFDDTRWEATVYDKNEMDKLMEAEQYDKPRQELQKFWKRYTNKS